jgi:hypothetical protein
MTKSIKPKRLMDPIHLAFLGFTGLVIAIASWQTLEEPSLNGWALRFSINALCFIPVCVFSYFASPPLGDDEQ